MPQLSPQTRTAALVALLAFALALVMRLMGVDTRASWIDEAYTQFAVSRDWGGLVYDRVRHGHSPVYFALMKAMGIDPANLIMLRGVSAVFDSLGAAVLSFGLAVFAGWRRALGFAVLYALSPVMIQWGGQNARPYGLLMFFLSIGLVGSFALLALAGRTEGAEDSAEARRGRWLFGIGFGGAAATMTAGVFSFITVAATPYLLPRLRRDRPWRKLWRKALIPPGIMAFVVYMLVSRLNIAHNVGSYWADKYRPFELDSLLDLWLSLLQGSARAKLFYKDWLPELADSTVEVVLSAALLSLAILGARRTAARNVTLPLIGLGIGYAAILILSSVSTSVLIDRYFLPAWQPLLALAGLGAAAGWQTAWVRAAGAVVLVFFLIAGVHQSLYVYVARGEEATSLGPFIYRNRDPDDEVFASKSWRTPIKMALIEEMLDEPGPRRRPGSDTASVKKIREALDEGSKTFLAVPDSEWDETYAAALPAPDCLLKPEPGKVIAMWGLAPEPECSGPTAIVPAAPAN